MKFLFRRADRASSHGARAGGGSRFLLAIVASFAAATLAVASLSPARAQTDFYTIASSELGFYSNGALIRSQPMWGAPDGAAAYRILYRSEGLNGEPIAVSGVVIVPDGSPPPGGRPIVAWAHPTTGVARACAPSLARVLFRSIQGLRGMLAQGYAVAATDYPGLGTPGPHPYLVGVSEGRAVLDSVRAARTIPGVGGGVLSPSGAIPRAVRPRCSPVSSRQNMRRNCGWSALRLPRRLPSFEVSSTWIWGRLAAITSPR